MRISFVGSFEIWASELHWEDCVEGERKKGIETIMWANQSWFTCLLSWLLYCLLLLLVWHLPPFSSLLNCHQFDVVFNLFHPIKSYTKMVHVNSGIPFCVGKRIRCSCPLPKCIGSTTDSTCIFFFLSLHFIPTFVSWGSFPSSIYIWFLFF